ncbi:MAG: SDR family oxidoreductase [Ktedonobacteraceae bacterium]|nr:SDR family oxidoreductase [Ktedonobacteraceae bacterium]
MTQTVLITGSSSGIGQATAQLFVERGWNVVATARNPEAVTRSASGTLLALPLDVTDEASIAAAVAATMTRFGSIDVLVNNAGYGLFGPLEGTSAEQLEAQFRTNVFGVAAMIRQVVPFMRQRHDGTIITISSTGGRVASPFAAAYHASKYALEGLCESLRFELRPQGIRVKLVEPGHVKTGFARALTWATHDAYEPHLSNWRAQVIQSDDHAPGCEGVARVIFNAATDQSWRLRYPAQAGSILALHAALPDTLWASILNAGMNRPPRSR